MPRTTQKKRPRRPAGPAVETTIQQLTPDGLGWTPHEGKELLVSGAFPGERIVAEIENEGQRRLVGRLRRVLQPSPDRVKPPCSHAGPCQGCPLIALDYPAQLAFKEERVRGAVQVYGSLQGVKIHPIVPAPSPLGYRTNAKLAFARVRGKVLIGLYRRGTHEVVEIGECPLHHPLINRIVAVVREEVERQEIFVYNPLRRTGLLRYLTVKVSPAYDKAMVTFVTAQKEYRQLTRLAKWLQRKVPEVISVQQNVNPSEGNAIFGRETLKILGAPDLFDRVGDLRLRISPTSFFQVNNEQAANIYRIVRQWAALSSGESAVDLYTGIGGIALNLARDAGQVIGIEVVEEAVRNARENARLNELSNCIFRAGDAAELVEDLSLEISPGAVAVVNPPRSGCEPEALRALAALQPRTLLYVSCDPQTLARDLDRLSEAGYRTAEVQPVDMFPQTPHVESVARLVPAGKRTTAS